MTTWQEFDDAWGEANAELDFARCAEIEADAEATLSPEDFNRFLEGDGLVVDEEGPICYCDPNEGHDCTYFTGGSGYN